MRGALEISTQLLFQGRRCMAAKVCLHLLQGSLDLGQLFFSSPAQRMIRRHPGKLVQEQCTFLTKRRLERQQARVLKR